MALNFGTSGATALYFGTQSASKAYLGTTLVFGNDIDYAKEYFTLEILSGGTISWNITGNRDGLAPLVYYSFDEVNWTPMATSGETVFNVNVGDKVRFRGDNTAIATRDYDSSRFSNSTAHFNAYGNIMSFINSTNFEGTNLTGYADWKGLFRYAKIHSAKNLIVPSVCSTQFTFRSTFANCDYLTEAPDSFSAITKLLAYSFLNTFTDSTAITAITLPSADANYTRVYDSTFSGCTNLSYVKCLTTNINASQATSNWMTGVAANGTFVKNANMTSWTTGNHGIPSGWTVIDYV